MFPLQMQACILTILVEDHVYGFGPDNSNLSRFHSCSS